MKTHLALLAGCLALVPASHAVTVTILEDSDERLDFTLEWGENFGNMGTRNANQLGLGSSEIGVSDLMNHLSVKVDWSQRTGPDDTFDIFFKRSADRLFSEATVGGFQGFQTLSLDGGAYGARFIYGAALPQAVPAALPDAGHTAGLLAVALGALTAFRWRSRQTPCG